MEVKNIWCVVRHGNNFGEKKLKVDTGQKYILDINISATTVAFFSKDKMQMSDGDLVGICIQCVMKAKSGPEGV